MRSAQAGTDRILPAGVAAAGFERLQFGRRTLLYAPIARTAGVGGLPIALRVMLENLTRQALLGDDVAGELEALVGRLPGARLGIRPARVLLDEVAGVPLLIDLVSLRDAVAAAGGDVGAVCPRLPVDFLVDSGGATAGASGARQARGELLAWCLRRFGNLRVLSASAPKARWPDHKVPCDGLRTGSVAGGELLYPDLLVGTHPRTSAAGGQGVLGWGVGGPEALLMVLGKPLSLTVPEVVGVELRGRPSAQLEPGELAVRMGEQLHDRGVADKLVEFFGRGVEALPVSTRAMVTLMAPRIGAACLYFPIDRRTLEHLRGCGGGEEKVRLLEQYAKLQSLWFDGAARAPDYDRVVSLDLGRQGCVSIGARRGAHPGERFAAMCPARGRAVGILLRERTVAAEMPDARGRRFPWGGPGGRITRVPFFDGLPLSIPGLGALIGARTLVMIGDAACAEDISPSGDIAPGSAAAAYLLCAGAAAGEVGSYEAWRGNYEVAMRATFAGTRLKNRLAGGARGGVTMLMPERISMSVFDAATEYQRRNVPLLVIAGGRYGCGCGHEWAAKGVASLGVRAVIAESFERIHRASLLAAGVLPLLFVESWKRLLGTLDGSETFDLTDLDWSVGVRTPVRCVIRRGPRPAVGIALRTAIETADELYYLRSGGILPALWREHLRGATTFASAPGPLVTR